MASSDKITIRTDEYYAFECGYYSPVRCHFDNKHDCWFVLNDAIPPQNKENWAKAIAATHEGETMTAYLPYTEPNWPVPYQATMVNLKGFIRVNLEFWDTWDKDEKIAYLGTLLPSLRKGFFQFFVEPLNHNPWSDKRGFSYHFRE
ncbi:MAG: hypothetical protein LBJ61_02475 [Deltaproteobacteria bacterium]|jgi:hypothetical protein|nr:hypothetical protein [Deltaproteobacteria bacterium]